MLDAYKKFWKGYVDFSGRSTRSDFWFAILANFLICMLLVVLFAILATISEGRTDGPLYTVGLLIVAIGGLYFVAIFLPMIAIQIRRLRDAGYHWALIFLRLLFGIGGIIVLVLLCQPTKVDYPNINSGLNQQ